MKFSIDKSKFIEALSHTIKIIAPNTLFEALKGIKLELTEDKIIFKSSDSLVTLEYSLDKEIENNIVLEVEETGEVVLPSKHIIDIIRKSTADMINIETNNENILIKAGNSEYTLKGYEVEEYPLFPDIEKNDKLIINSKILNNIIKETVFCTAPNDQRPILEGVNFVLEKKFLTATATDSYRLSKRKILFNELDKEKSFNMVIPRKALIYLQRFIENKETDINIFYQNNRVIFKFENIIYTVLLISGKYPNTEKLMPSVFECLITSNSKALYDVIDRVSLMSRDDKNDIIKLVLKDNLLEISSYSKELGSAVEDIIVSANYEGEKFEISASAKYMKEAIHAIDSEKIIIKFSGELTAFVIQPVDNHRDIIQLILPVRTY